MTLIMRRWGKAWLVPGRPWTLDVRLGRGGRRMWIPVLPEGVPWPRDHKGPPLPPPAWADIDRCLAEMDCERRGPATDAPPEAGTELDVVAFDAGPPRTSGTGPDPEEARPVTRPWQQVRDAVHGALREALSRPGRQGLAARDELLDVLRTFADVHRDATAADDEEQRRLQAARPEE
ncbi:hypothetical protein [Streptomyces sp. NPDC002640]